MPDRVPADMLQRVGASTGLVVDEKALRQLLNLAEWIVVMIVKGREEAS